MQTYAHDCPKDISYEIIIGQNLMQVLGMIILNLVALSMERSRDLHVTM